MNELMTSVPGIIRPAQDLAKDVAFINAHIEAGNKGVWRGLEHYRKAGERLLQVRAFFEQPGGHGQWQKWLKANFQFSRMEAWRYMRLAEEWEKCNTMLHLTDALRILTQEEIGPGQAHVSHNSGVSEWHTPPEYIEAAVEVLGAIDLDPASSNAAQKIVKAKEFFTAEHDGLSLPWKGKVWMNPPYAAELVGKFVAKLCEHYQSGDVPAALLLVNNATDTSWLQQALKISRAVCFPDRRVRFLDPEGNPGAPLQGQAVVYFGPDVEKFARHFGMLGLCFKRIFEGLRNEKSVA